MGKLPEGKPIVKGSPVYAAIVADQKTLCPDAPVDILDQAMSEWEQYPDGTLSPIYRRFLLRASVHDLMKRRANG
ncbi:hypothetical protein [Mesorhizobium temperatum]|uniref:Uncharacterized protein n=1 Tax=Mesorhizobium temperatum TaxID=241416 RepID=A0A271LNS2_9HYPH|nr:hypothetical protein [Mesorhizobium temperatum]PAQ09729.1 hypothetical protein CIT26_11860 [Mesorhizobium temperatum]